MLIGNLIISALGFLQNRYLESMETYRVHYGEQTMTITILPWAKPAVLTLTFFIPISVMMSLSGGLTMFFVLLFCAGIPLAVLLRLARTSKLHIHADKSNGLLKVVMKSKSKVYSVKRLKAITYDLVNGKDFADVSIMTGEGGTSVILPGRDIETAQSVTQLLNNFFFEEEEEGVKEVEPGKTLEIEGLQ